MREIDKLLTVDDVAQALQVCRRTAYTYMAQMYHLERPRRVTERALQNWIQDRSSAPKDAAWVKSAKRQRRGAWRPETTDYRIPRRREGDT